MMKIRPATIALTTLTTAALPALLVVAPAHAGDGDVEKARNCGGFRIELKVGREDAGWEVESDVDDARAGSRWRIKIRQDGRMVFNRLRTAGRQGDVEVDLRRRNTAGTDTFRFTAHPAGNPARRCSLQITRG